MQLLHEESFTLLQHNRDIRVDIHCCPVGGECCYDEVVLEICRLRQPSARPFLQSIPRLVEEFQSRIRFLLLKVMANLGCTSYAHIVGVPPSYRPLLPDVSQKWKGDTERHQGEEVAKKLGGPPKGDFLEHWNI